MSLPINKKDVRLQNAVTEYRLWRDSHTALIRKGESTTRPLQPEQVSVNVRAHGKVNKGIYQPPQVWFTNTEMSEEYFDHYHILTYRFADDIADLLYTEKDISDILELFDKTGMSTLDIQGDISITNSYYTVDEHIPNAYNRFKTKLYKDILEIRSNDLHFDNGNISGTYYLSNTSDDFSIETDLNILSLTDRIYIKFIKLELTAGNSKIDLMRTPEIFAETLIEDISYLELLGGS